MDIAEQGEQGGIREGTRSKEVRLEVKVKVAMVSRSAGVKKANSRDLTQQKAWPGDSLSGGGQTGGGSLRELRKADGPVSSVLVRNQSGVCRTLTQVKSWLMHCPAVWAITPPL